MGEEQSEDQTFDHARAHAAQKAYCAEKRFPLFAGGGGRCSSCRRNVYDRQTTSHHQRSAVMEDGGLVDIGEATEHVTGISVEEAGRTLVTGCPHCHRSFCD